MAELGRISFGRSRASASSSGPSVACFARSRGAKGSSRSWTRSSRPPTRLCEGEYGVALPRRGRGAPRVRVLRRRGHRLDHRARRTRAMGLDRRASYDRTDRRSPAGSRSRRSRPHPRRARRPGVHVPRPAGVPRGARGSDPPRRRPASAPSGSSPGGSSRSAQEVIDLVETFADQAAIAITNARLIDAIERQLDEQQAVAERHARAVARSRRPPGGPRRRSSSRRRG